MPNSSEIIMVSIRLLLYLIFIFFIMGAYGQNQPPTIKNFKAEFNNKEKKLTISYDSFDPEETEIDITVHLIGKDGKRFLLDGPLIKGDIGSKIKIGKNKYITWNYPDSVFLDSNYKLQIAADDKYEIDINSLLNQIKSENLYDNLNEIYGIRHYIVAPDHLAKVRNYITTQFNKGKLKVESQEFDISGYTAANVIGTIKGVGSDPSLIILGAHFDTVSDSPGADDNGSGVVALLEVMKVLSQHNFNNSIVFAGLDQEEFGFLGSKRFIQSIPTTSMTKIIGYINLDMIGYYSEEANSQIFPEALKKIFPMAYYQVSENGFRGNFILNTSNYNSKLLQEHFDLNAIKYSPELEVVSILVPDNGKFAPSFFRVGDHIPFWDNAIPAINIGDAGDTRNLNYHSPEDTMETINYKLIANTAKALLATIAELAEIRHLTISQCIIKKESIKGNISGSENQKK